MARCGQERLYPWGNEWPPKYGNFGNQELFPKNFKLHDYTDKYPVTCPVEESGANEWNICGLAGNAWEWTSAENGDRRGVFGSAWTETNKRTLLINPKGNYAPLGEPYDNIGIRVILAPVK